VSSDRRAGGLWRGREFGDAGVVLTNGPVRPPHSRPGRGRTELRVLAKSPMAAVPGPPGAPSRIQAAVPQILLCAQVPNPCPRAPSSPSSPAPGAPSPLTLVPDPEPGAQAQTPRAARRCRRCGRGAGRGRGVRSPGPRCAPPGAATLAAEPPRVTSRGPLPGSPSPAPVRCPRCCTVPSEGEAGKSAGLSSAEFSTTFSSFKTDFELKVLHLQSRRSTA
jgi:hypothetical protein